MCSHLAFVTGENGHADEKIALKSLASLFGAAIPENFGNHLAFDLGRTQLIWERHTEFSTYTFLNTWTILGVIPLNGSLTPPCHKSLTAGDGR